MKSASSFTNLAGEARVILGAIRLLQVAVAPTRSGPSDAIDWITVEEMLSELALKMDGIKSALDRLADGEASRSEQ